VIIVVYLLHGLTDKGIANTWAKGPSGTNSGVVMTIRVRKSEAIKSTLQMGDGEYLLIGIKKAQKVENAK